MALDKAALKAGIVQLHTEMRTRENDAIDEYAERLSDLIETFVKSATIKYNTGLVAATDPVTGTFNGQLE